MCKCWHRKFDEHGGMIESTITQFSRLDGMMTGYWQKIADKCDAGPIGGIARIRGVVNLFEPTDRNAT